MAGYGYSWVPDRGFSAFSHDLEEGAWKAVAIEKYDTPDRMSPQLFEAPRPVVWKLRARWSIAALDDVLGIASTSEVAALDAEWDAAQRAFNFFVASAEQHEDAAVRESAGRIRKAMLSGNGTEQTGFGYDQEVDFGRAQIVSASKKPSDADLKRIGATAHLKRIEKATEALAKGIGRGSGAKRPVARSKRLREATSACVTTFNSIHDELAWFIEHTPAGKPRAQLEALHAPFLALLERYPPQVAPASEAGQSVEEQPKPSPAPAPAESGTPPTKPA